MAEIRGRPPVAMSRLRDIGWTRWDPIGIGPPQPEFADEYNRYIWEAFCLLRRGAPPADVAERLMWIEVEQIGLCHAPDADRRAAATVEALYAYVVELDGGHPSSE
jgi:hypothetical protein